MGGGCGQLDTCGVGGGEGRGNRAPVIPVCEETLEENGCGGSASEHRAGVARQRLLHRTSPPLLAQAHPTCLALLFRFRELPVLPFNAFGTMAIAREEFDANSGSSQFFWLLKVGACALPAYTCCWAHIAHARTRTHARALTPTHPHLQESELTPTGANLLDGRYAVFGYVTEGSQLLKEMQVGGWGWVGGWTWGRLSLPFISRA